MPAEKAGKKSSGKKASKSVASASSSTSSAKHSKSLGSPPKSTTPVPSIPPPTGFLLSCDIPTKQYVMKLNDDKSADKKFVIEDLDETHLLIEGKAREEIIKAVEDWMDEREWEKI